MSPSCTRGSGSAPADERLRSICTGLLAVVCVALATAPAAGESLTGRVSIAFSATSTLHDFGGTIEPVAFTPATDAARRWSAEIDVPVAAMSTGNERRDAGMHAMLEGEKFPHVRGTFRDIEPAALRAGGVLPFELAIRNVTRPVTAVIAKWNEEERHLAFDASFTVSLAEFGLTAPRVLFIGVGDRVTVTVHVTLDRS